MLRHVILCALLAPMSALAQDLSIAAMRIGSPDMGASAAFYEKHLGFTIVDDMREHGFIVLMNDDDYLVITEGEFTLAHSESCYANLNFLVPDLDETMASFKEAGVTLVKEDRSAVGRYATFLDPGMHRFNVKQLDDASTPVDGPRLYNVGVSVADMDKAVAFYEGVLGFKVLTKDYYPPVVVFQPQGSAYFILSDKTVTAPSAYTDEYFTGMAFETSDIHQTMKTLSAKGVKFTTPEPVHAGPVLAATFRDPFGNVHELIEHVSMPTMDDLSMLDGRWIYEFPGGFLEEVWLTAAGDGMTGTMRQVQNGRTTLLELFNFTQEEDGSITYRLRHFDGTLTPWESEADGPMTGVVTEAGDGRIVITFDGGGVTQITYEQTSETAVTATVHFGEERDPFVIPFMR